MRVSRFGSRAIGTAVLFALAGFSYALATALPASGPLGVAPRAVGSYLPLRFTTPNVLGTTGLVLNPNEYDLGDAAFGSLITRYLTAEGGIRPYRFTSTGANSLANQVANTDSTLTLGISGVMAGFTPSSVNASSVTFLGTPGLRFQATVTDARGTNAASATGFFNLFLVDSTKVPFRFANDTVPSARLDTPYVAQVSAIGGSFGAFFDVLAVTDSGGNAIKLSDLGLFISPSGKFFGRPLAVGTYQITIRGTDGLGAIALSRRNPAVTDQTFTLVVGDNPVTTSDVVTLSCTISGDLQSFGRDSVRMSGLINALGMDQTTLANSTFSFHIAGFGFSGTLDKNGVLRFTAPDLSMYSARVNAKRGSIMINCGRGTFSDLVDLTGVKDGDTVRRPIEVTIGQAVVSSEVIDFIARIEGTHYELSFNQGRTGTNASGGFQILSVAGNDGTSFTGQLGDAWKVKFMALPRAGVTNPNGLREGLDNITAVNVRIGTNFAEQISGGGIIGAGPKVHFVGGPTDGLQSFQLSTTTGKGTIVTRTLSAFDTNIPQAQNALPFDNLFFTLGIDVSRLSKDQTYIGEHARRIFNFAKKYTDHPAPRQTTPVP